MINTVTTHISFILVVADHTLHTRTHTHIRYDFCCSKYLIGVNVSGLKFEFLVFNLFLCSASVDGSCLVSVTDGCVDSIVG